MRGGPAQAQRGKRLLQFARRMVRVATSAAGGGFRRRTARAAGRAARHPPRRDSCRAGRAARTGVARRCRRGAGPRSGRGSCLCRSPRSRCRRAHAPGKTTSIRGGSAATWGHGALALRAAAWHVAGPPRSGRVGRVGPGSRGTSGHGRRYVRRAGELATGGLATRGGLADMCAMQSHAPSPPVPSPDAPSTRAPSSHAPSHHAPAPKAPAPNAPSLGESRAARLDAALTAAFSPVVLRIQDDSARHAGHAGAQPGGADSLQRAAGLGGVRRDAARGSVPRGARGAEAGIRRRHACAGADTALAGGVCRGRCGLEHFRPGWKCREFPCHCEARSAEAIPA